ncbi:MAG: alanine racemase, partial [Clostridiaceae bacterium]
VQYGYQPSDEVHKERLPLKPILDWKAKIVLVKTISKGTPVSYGNTFVAEKDTVIGTIPLGYADGYSRSLSSKGSVIYKGKLCPIVGRVCMDQMMVDLSGVENPTEGDTVILLGKDGDVKYDGDDMAKTINTISYEITCDIGKRVPRRYTDKEA